jgi:hypothetical protein
MVCGSQAGAAAVQGPVDWKDFMMQGRARLTPAQGFLHLYLLE